MTNRLDEEKAEFSGNPIEGLRDRLADNLGVNSARKVAIYKELLESVSLQDVSYWLQVLFAAGIATLGLALNSPAVIIGAMLISPLMGGILANGLAFAVGDFILAIRAIANLCFSCLTAIAFAFILVSILPFKELTSEIAFRTQPTTLDLAIALFSGALGAVATSKRPKGVVTSIPGVAIAVALMPPLCVVGYGLGVAVSLDGKEGLRVASGGGLLFLTNLSAIMLMAMVVFWTLHINIASVDDRVREWHQEDPESLCVRKILEAFPASKYFTKIGGSRSRFILLLIPVCLLIFPLSQSLDRLQQEIAQKQLNNRTVLVATNLWRQDFAKLPDGNWRSEIGKVAVQERDGKVVLQMSVFANKFYDPQEKARYRQMVASRLNRDPDSIVLRLTEIPTATSEIITKLAAEPALPETPAKAPPTVAETQATLLQTVEAALEDLKLPPPARLLRYDVITSTSHRFSLNLVYLSEREIGSDAKVLLAGDLRTRLQFPTADINLERVAVDLGALTFDRDRLALTTPEKQLLDRAGRALQQQPNLQLQLTARSEPGEPEGQSQKREQLVRQYLANQWQIDSDRLSVVAGQPLKSGEKPTLSLRFQLSQ